MSRWCEWWHVFGSSQGVYRGSVLRMSAGCQQGTVGSHASHTGGEIERASPPRPDQEPAI